jgi:hypothetical protein
LTGWPSWTDAANGAAENGFFVRFVLFVVKTSLATDFSQSVAKCHKINHKKREKPQKSGH